MKRTITLLMFFAVSVFSQFTDSRDGKKYKTAKIGKQTWMAENLNYNAKGSECYDNNESNCKKYGRLYDWATAMNIDAKFNEEEYGGGDVKHQGVCPSGWHLPSDKEWTELMNFLVSNKKDVHYGEEEYIDYYENAGKYLKAKSGWKDNGNGTDEFGFSALPGGYGNSDGDFSNVGDVGYWWSSTEYNSYDAYNRYLYYYSYVGRDDDGLKSGLLSVRCVQD